MTHEFRSSMAAPDERLWAGNSLLHRRSGDLFTGGRASLFCLEPNPGLGQSGPLTNIVIGLLSLVLCVTSRFADPAGIPAPALFGRELCPSTELTYPHQ